MADTRIDFYKPEPADEEMSDVCDGTQSGKNKPSCRRFDRVRQFEEEVRRARGAARCGAILHIISRYSAICALTWATAVLLGGFVSTLGTFDFYFISAVLLAESIRLFIIHTIANTLSRGWFREKPDPHDFKFEDRQHVRADGILYHCSTLSVCISVSVALISTIRLSAKSLFLPAAAVAQEADAANLQRSLRIVYVLFTLSSSVAVFSFDARPGVLRLAMARSFGRGLLPFHRILSLGACTFNRVANVGASPTQPFLTCFYDEVYRTAINAGLGEIDRLDILDFAFTFLGRDFERNIRPQIIKAQNSDLITYLYHSDLGITMACEILQLKSSDVWRQVVAANLPGFWADEPKIEQQLCLFWALGEKMHGPGKDAEGALNSIGFLAESFERNKPMKGHRHPFLTEDPAIANGRSCIVSRLLRLVCSRVRPTLLPQIRALEACLQNNQVLQYLRRDMAELQNLWDELENVVTSMRTGARTVTRMYAASALVSLLDCHELSTEKKQFLREKVKHIIKQHAREVGELKSRGKGITVWLIDVITLQRMMARLELEDVSYKDWWGKMEGVSVRSHITGKTLTEQQI